MPGQYWMSDEGQTEYVVLNLISTLVSNAIYTISHAHFVCFIKS